MSLFRRRTNDYAEDPLSVIALLRNDIADVKIKLDEITRTMVRRDELERVQRQLDTLVPRQEHESRWRGEDERFARLELTVNSFRDARLGPRLDTLESIAVPAVQVRLAEIEKNYLPKSEINSAYTALADRVTVLERRQLPTWAWPSLTVLLGAIALFAQHFWK